MKSIRPLVTISFLGIVFLFLYVKINETEPVVPEETQGWNLDSALELEIGDAAAEPAPAVAESAATEAPSYEPAPAYNAVTTSEAPPAFVPEAPAAKVEPAVSVPAATQPLATAVTQQIDAPTQTASTEVAANSLKLPPMPALPELGAAVAAGGAAAATVAAATSQSATPTAQPVVQTPTTTAPANPTATPAQPATQPQDTTQQTVAAPPYDMQSPVTPTESFPSATPSASQASLYSTTRLAVQGALDRGELAQALLLLSDWYGDPSLTPDEAAEVQDLLNQLAGSVIYSTEHRLEPPYLVKPGERLEDIANQYNVPSQLLAKINGIADPNQLQPGQQLKVVRGPFSARIDLGKRKLVMMLDRRYAGQFDIDITPSSTIEEGYWSVNQKLLTPGNAAMSSSSKIAEERSLLLTSSTPGVGQLTVLRGPSSTPGAGDVAGRVIQLNTTDVQDVYDILSLGSQIIIRR